MNLKLGQIFWVRELNEYGGIGRSDFECKVIGKKVCQFLNGKNFTDFLVEITRLNDYHVSFSSKESRTHNKTFRFDLNTKELKYWHEQHWPGNIEEWRPFKDKIFKTKPKDLRSGP